MLTLGILHTTIRSDEKLIIDQALKRKINVELIDVRTQVLNPSNYKPNYEIALSRCISTVKGTYATHFLENLGITVINSSSIDSICEDKFITSLTLKNAKVATPPFALVFDIEGAKKAVEEVGGYPIVIKPNLGSWGRLLAKINDDDSLEAIVEYINVLGSPEQKAIYIQKFINKPGRDIRAFAINGKTICAIYRESEHWITNTARGGVAKNCKVTKDLSDIVRAASNAIGGGILAMDVFELNDSFSINEVNHTMEFKNSEQPTGVSISGEIINYCMEIYKKL